MLIIEFLIVRMSLIRKRKRRKGEKKEKKIENKEKFSFFY